MYKFYFRACLFITLLIFPYVIYAAGLGKLTLNSALGQPLKAEIDLVAVKNNESSSLTANLASQEAFRQAGISYEPFFSTLEMAIDARSNGDPYIRITSLNSINEPFLNVLVELSWTSGRLMREYTVLLDPAEAATPEPVAPTIVDAPVVAETYSDEPEVQAAPVIEQIQAEPAVVSESFPGDTYGPVSQGDTLSKIAQQISPNSTNLNQIMIALFRANQSAFIGNNINLIKVGEVLRIPSINEIEEISVMEANAEVKVHVADWRNYKNELAGVSNEAPAAESLKQIDSGEIITAVEDEFVALEAQPEEVLRLSGGVHTEDMLGSSSEGESDMSQERIRMIEEDSIARSLALIEANERIELLEKNIKNLQQLLELKDPALAQAQIQAENAYEEISNTHDEILIDDLVPESIDDVLPALENIIDITEQKLDELLSSNTELDESIAALDFAEELNNAPADVSTELPVEAPVEASIMDQLMDNIAYVGGLLAFMLLSALIAIKIRRNKAEKEVDEDELDFDSSSSLRNRVASIAAADALAAHEESDISHVNEDSLAPEAEVQAETEANFDTPDTNNSKEDSEEIDLDFSQEETLDEGIAEPASLLDEEDISQPILEPELESGADIDLDLDHLDESNVKSDDQEQPIELADKLIQDNVDDSAVDSLAGDTTGSDEELAFTDEAIASLEEAIQSERQAVAETSEPELPEADAEEGEAAQQGNEMDFEFNLDSENLTDGETPSAVTEEVGGEAESPESDNSISFDLDTPREPAEDVSLDQVSEETETQSQKEKLDLAIDSPEGPDTPEANQKSSDEVAADANLNFAAIPTETTTLDNSVTAAEPEEHDEHWHDVETKIDLAKAYIEMDDGEGAKEILEEVAKEGDAGQQEKAKNMLEVLP